MRARTGGLIALIALLGTALAVVALVHWAALPAVGRPDPYGFDQATIAQGAGLAKIGDCTVCHTARPDAPYAGGVAVATPFGVIHASNITPDVETGIGTWSEAAFARAMREGVSRDGDHLYPAFPYDHFTHASDGDLHALYAFLMTRRPVWSRPPANQLAPPFGFRPLLAAWKLRYLDQTQFRLDPVHDAEWNRGAYLVQGLAHCGACHTPRDRLGGEVASEAFDGGWAEGWYAPALNAKSPAASPWTADRLDAYLTTGIDNEHAAAAGPMGEVTRELSAAPAADVRAMAVYVAWLMRDAPANRTARPPPMDREAQAAHDHPQGAALFAGACAICHGPGAAMALQGRPGLQRGSPLMEPEPRDTVQIILRGLQPPAGASGPYMPPFGNAFSDAQVAEIAAYLRARYSDQPPWPDLAKASAEARREGAS